MSKFQGLMLVLVGGILAVTIVVASVVVLDFKQRREERLWLHERLQQTSSEIAGKVDQANRNAASTQLRAFRGPLDAFRLDVGKYPSSFDELRIRPAKAQQWSGPYLNKEIPLDPWGNPYQYRVSEDKIELWSFGPDGKDGTPDDIRLEEAIGSK
jgi:general secretion pathway protein G